MLDHHRSVVMNYLLRPRNGRYSVPGMTLDQYLESKGEGTREFARRIKKDAATVSRIRRGIQEPSIGTAHEIVIATDGLVRHRDLCRRPKRRVM